MSRVCVCKLGGVLAAGLAIGAIGCSREAAVAVAVVPPVVEVSQPIQREVTEFRTFTGSTDAVQSVEVRARVTGYLVKVEFTDGEEVAEGDLLFEIDARPYQAAFDEADAAVARGKAEEVRANAEFARAEKLRPTRAITEEEFERRVAEQLTAVGSLREAEATRERAALDLEFTKVKAPIAGRVSRALVTPGNLVSADVTLLTTIVSLDPIYAYFDVDERSVLEIQRRIRESELPNARKDGEVLLELALAGDEGYPHRGHVDFVDNRVDPQTGTLRVRGVFENPQRILSPGLFCRVRFAVSKPREALLVAERAIGTEQRDKFVYVVDDANQVERRSVKLGPQSHGLRVIAEGLKPDDRVIVSGLQRVRAGVTVDPRPVAMAAQADLEAAIGPSAEAAASDFSEPGPSRPDDAQAAEAPQAPAPPRPAPQ